ncbi:MAG: sensor histidine kinase [Nitrospinae bacterium]|nr:sensor histidine kinase [Nitrospinota bacterium]
MNLTIASFVRVVCLIMAALPSAAFAFEPFELRQEMNGAYLGEHVEHLEDKTKSLTIEKALSGRFKTNFKPVQGETINLGVSRYPQWFHFSVRNAATTEIPWILLMENPLQFRLEVYEVLGNGKYRFHQGGLQIPFDRRDIAHRKNAFSMKTSPGTGEIYVKCWSDGDVFLANATMTAWSPKHFAADNNGEAYLLGVFYGALSALFFYNLFIFFTVRDASYLWYVSYLVLITFTYISINGLGSQYFWPYYPFLNELFFYFGAGFFFQLFSRSFLGTKERLPVFDKIIVAGILVSFFFLVLAATGVDSSIVSLAGYPIQQLFVVASFFAGIKTLRAGVRHARFYVIAWIPFILAMPPFVLRDFGFLPDSTFVTYSVQVATLLEALLFSFALADRIRILREEKENAENATRLKDKFVALVSHDLKSPLLGIIELLKVMDSDAKKPLDSEHSARLKKILNSSRGLVKMINKLLDVNQLQIGAITPAKMKINCHGLVERHIELVRFLAEKKGVCIRNNVPPGMFVTADPDLLGECVSNLLSNAIKFCDGGREVTVFNPGVAPTTLAVRDDGPGVDEQFLPGLFRREIKTSSMGTGGERGTGFGLPFCNDIMKAHGGSITVESETGLGSTFYLVLPDEKPTEW